ncbi:MAG: NADH:ubiquinone oxidoreductase subunit A [Elusimicrobia bacterium RIFCSPLOWO2_02_FULL_39_32]|nr:MAG: NADH:ubiquinone oxidoreductase subunit A [Elusimicrobia bacterium RIFCSPHIGHO2_02_FULL_39_36]OGR91402.1 MAG: NADH:ubiquinone oxidoreductase subunit A [Elusimicrobia bacterium RIFCSPLOWO2_02_FULL_39_32]OGR98517.1 MAG: NADH:ubiquinone oxidoreductase subunit A [Elusimicrobia bacterium RIFCSPLOWO2_12_FULL_39_28]
MISNDFSYLKDYGQIGVFLLFGLFFASFSLFLAWLLRTRNNDPLFPTTYECGSEPIGSSFVQMNVRFYLFALLFVIFDVETLFIYPWAVAYKSLGIIGFFEMVIFIAILFIGLIYAWRKSALKWEQ